MGLIWAGFLFVCTCTINFWAMVKYQFIYFRFNEQPNWHELLKVKFDWHDKSDIIQKAGHFGGFFILALILTDLGKYKSGIPLSLGYAVITEILQLYFHRDGRVVDIFIDALGILLAYSLCMMFDRTAGKAMLQ